jgi:8-oxo-dGTP diphosphatase
MIIGVLGVIRKEGKYLLGLETKNNAFKGKWRLLGGKAEEGETFEQTLIRELEEEAQIQIKIIKKLEVYQGKTIPIHIFLADWVGGEIKTKEDENEKIELFSAEEAKKLDTEKLTKEILEKYI